MRKTVDSKLSETWAATIRLLNRDDWPLIETLFGANGACGGCWCMYWRVPRHGKQWDAAKGELNRRSFLRLVTEGRLHGVVALSDGAPVGWCCFGPREDFPRLLQSRNLQRPEAGERWSVVCFFVQRAFRRRGLGVRLLKAATDAAIVHGVSEVEGYPKKVRAGSWPPGPFIWTGTEAMFAAAGYRKLSRGEEMPPIYVFSVPWAFSPRACPLGTGDGVDLGRGRARPRLPAKLALAANRGPVYLLGTGESVETPMATSPVIPAKAGS